MLPLAGDVAGQLDSCALGWPIEGWAELDSTNTRAQAWAADGAPHGAVVLAEFQKKGRGQPGHRWLAAAGQNLLFSVILRPALDPSSFGLVTLAGSLAVAETLAPMVAPLSVTIKWPNDVMIEDQKCCGILSESAVGPGTLVVVGIGLNVNQSVFPEEIARRATSVLLVTGRPANRAGIMVGILTRFAAYLEMTATQPATLIEHCTSRLYRIGQDCHVRQGPDQFLRGRILGLSATGALRLDTHQKVMTVHTGNLS
ncbi:MAG: biotin--[acetyl-CoA-carboxylase] ligase [Bacteroidota bacterium]|nr:biotin--[acetyl-CoA-carboxylase] ligase [Bacteroidota bacterium]